MPQDAVTLLKQANNLNFLLSEGKVNKITQPISDQINLNVYSKNGLFKLCLSANAQTCRVGLNQLDSKNPLVAPNFCMLLRKHLLNSTLSKIELVNFERIIKLTFISDNEFYEKTNKQLYCEIMGKYSNLILCENDVILGTLKPAVIDLNKDRVLLVGATYKLPKPQDKINVYDKEKIISLLNNFNGGQLDNYLFNNVLGFSNVIAKEIVYRFFGQTSFENKLIKILEFYDFIIDFITNYESKSTVCKCNNKLLDYYFCDYKSIEGEKIFFDNICQAESYFYNNKQKNMAFEQLKNKLLSSLSAFKKKKNNKLQNILEKQQSCEKLDKFRLYGELITAYIYKIKKNDNVLCCENYYDDNKIVEIKLDSMLSPNENAQFYFKKYNKCKNTLNAIMPQKQEVLEQIDYCDSVLTEINNCQEYDDLLEVEDELKQSGIIKSNDKIVIKKSKADAKINFRTFSYNGYIIKAGKNNIQNDKLTSMAKPSDLWLHAKDYHSAHVIIESKGTHIPNEIIEVGAEICAFYSECKNGNKIPVDYTLKKYVKKKQNSNYGSVIYTDYKTCLVLPNDHKNLIIN